MTRNDLNRLIKSAAKKRTAFDTAKLTAALSDMAKPTGTGVAAGAGLGTILAAAGALSRSGEDPSNTSILSNPLLLGALGATGGYLAGNAFEHTPPTVHENNGISIPALAALAGGAGTLGTLTAKEQAKYELLDAERAFNDFLRQKIMGPRGRPVRLVDTSNDTIRVDGADKTVKRYNINKGRLDDEAVLNYEQMLRDKRTAFSRALRRNNNFAKAITDAEYARPNNVASRILERIRNSSYSPYRWLTAPFKGGKNTLKILRGIATRHKVPAALGGLALLAGGGKAIYDKVHD